LILIFKRIYYRIYFTCKDFDMSFSNSNNDTISIRVLYTNGRIDLDEVIGDIYSCMQSSNYPDNPPPH